MSQIDSKYRYYQPNRPSVTAVQSRRRSLLSVVRLLTTPAIAIFALFGFIHFVSTVTVADPSSAHTASVPSAPSSGNDPALAKAINGILQQNGDVQIGVALQNIHTGQLQTFGVTSPFVAASTAKVITACNYYHLVETSRASLASTLGTFNAAFQIKEMINNSDNDAWGLLENDIGDDELAAYASANGINYGVTDNTLTTAAMATVLTKLYNGQLLNSDDTKQLLSYMQNTNDEDLIPAAVPDDVTVYHKYGLLDGELHDAAILIQGNQAYSLVIYTKSDDDSDDQARTDTIHQITKAVTSSIFS